MHRRNVFILCTFVLLSYVSFSSCHYSHLQRSPGEAESPLCQAGARDMALSSKSRCEYATTIFS